MIGLTLYKWRQIYVLSNSEHRVESPETSHVSRRFLNLLPKKLRIIVGSFTRFLAYSMKDLTRIIAALIFMTGISKAQNDDPLPTIIVFGTDQTISCIDDPVRIGVTVNNWVEGIQYLWSNGSTDSSIFVKPGQTSIYSVTASHPDLNFYQTKGIKVKVLNLPVFMDDEFFNIDKFTCPDELITIGATPSGGHGSYSYLWNTGATDPQLEVQVNALEKYHVVVTDVCGSSTEADVIVLAEAHDPIVISKLTEFDFDCSGEEVKIWPKLKEMSGGVGYGYKYTFSNWEESNQSIVVNAMDNSIHTAYVTDACEAQSVETYVKLHQNEIVLPEFDEIIVCEGETVNPLEGTESAYIWDGFQMHAEYSELLAGDKNFELKYIDHCGDPHRILRAYSTHEVPSDFNFWINHFEPVADFYPLEESNGLVFKWYLNGDLVSDDEAPSLELEEGTTNEVMLETTNPAGCTHSTTREVIVQDGIEIPSAFSPNGDGKNESFRIRIEEELESFNIKIFDRWGQLHFESNDKNFEWFGIGNSSNQPINSYSYILKAKTVTGKDIKKTGTITVITTN